MCSRVGVRLAAERRCQVVDLPHGGVCVLDFGLVSEATKLPVEPLQQDIDFLGPFFHETGEFDNIGLVVQDPRADAGDLLQAIFDVSDRLVGAASEHALVDASLAVDQREYEHHLVFGLLLQVVLDRAHPAEGVCQPHLDGVFLVLGRRGQEADELAVEIS